VYRHNMRHVDRLTLRYGRKRIPTIEDALKIPSGIPNVTVPFAGDEDLEDIDDLMDFWQYDLCIEPTPLYYYNEDEDYDEDELHEGDKDISLNLGQFRPKRTKRYKPVLRQKTMQDGEEDEPLEWEVTADGKDYDPAWDPNFPDEYNEAGIEVIPKK